MQRVTKWAGAKFQKLRFYILPFKTLPHFHGNKTEYVSKLVNFIIFLRWLFDLFDSFDSTFSKKKRDGMAALRPKDAYASHDGIYCGLI